MIESIKERLSQIQGHVLGRPLDIQRALRSTGVQMPDGLDLMTVITGLSDDQVNRAAGWLRLDVFRDGYTADGAQYTIKSEQGLLGRLSGAGDLFVHCCQAPNHTQAYKLYFLHLGETALAMTDRKIRDYKFHKPGIGRVIVSSSDTAAAGRDADTFFANLKEQHFKEG